MDPINYSIDVQTPFQAAMQGYQAGAAIRNDQLQMQQQQQAMAAQQQMQQDLGALAAKPNASGADYAAVMTKYPQLSEQLGRSWSALNSAQQQAKLQQGTQAYAALQSGRPDIAEQLFRDRATAARNSGADQEAQQAETMAELIKLHPEAARTSIALSLSSHLGPDKFAQTFATLGQEQRASDQAPAALRTANANATTAEVTAGNAATAAELSNQKTAQEIKASQLQGQIATLNTQIAQANSETERGRLTLERDKLNAELAKTGLEQGQTTQSALDNNVQALSTVEGLLNHPGFSSWIDQPGTMRRKAMAMVPGTDAYDFEAQLQVLKSQQFLNNIQSMKGMGQLSDAEGKKIDSALANLDPNQSYKQLKNQLEVVRSTLQKAQSRLYNSGQLPTTKGQGAAVMAHPVYGQVTENTINALIRQHPGATRESVLQFLRSSGGQ